VPCAGQVERLGNVVTRVASPADLAAAWPPALKTQTRGSDQAIADFMLLDEISPACAAAADRVAGDLRGHLIAP
jgi:hypothetical protein